MTQEMSPSAAPRYVILAAVTFDKTGMQALLEAARLCELHQNSELHVVHVVHEAGPKRDRVPAARRLELAPAELLEYVQQACANAPKEVTPHVRAGSPSRAILRTAAEINAELIVVGAHRLSGVKKLMRGSVAEQVFRHSHCPVFIAVPKDYADKPVAPAPETVCPTCLAVRKRTYGGQLWCEKHERSRARRKDSAVLPLPNRTHYHP